MNKAIDELRGHFNHKLLPNSKVLTEERDKVNALIDAVETENDKLRRLAKGAWGCVNRHVSCDECRMVFCGCALQSAMRELGIEVSK